MTNDHTKYLVRHAMHVQTSDQGCKFTCKIWTFLYSQSIVMVNFNGYSNILSWLKSRFL